MNRCMHARCDKLQCCSRVASLSPTGETRKRARNQSARAEHQRFLTVRTGFRFQDEAHLSRDTSMRAAVNPQTVEAPQGAQNTLGTIICSKRRARYHVTNRPRWPPGARWYCSDQGIRSKGAIEIT